MRRNVMTLEQIINWVTEGRGPSADEIGNGITYWVEVENMGFCKTGARWYTFTGPNGKPCIYFKN